MVVCCSRNVCYMSLKGHIAIECHSQISGMRVGCHVSTTAAAAAAAVIIIIILYYYAYLWLSINSVLFILFLPVGNGVCNGSGCAVGY